MINEKYTEWCKKATKDPDVIEELKLISDNEELINVFRCIQDEAKMKKMTKELDKYEKEHSEEFYYDLRNKDRDKTKFNKLADYKKAARTI